MIFGMLVIFDVVFLALIAGARTAARIAEWRR